MVLTEEQKGVLDLARQLAGRELAPRAEEIDARQIFPRANLEQLAQSDFLGLAVPREQGGIGADMVSFVLAVEALGQACASTALLFLTQSVVARALALTGTDEQKRKYLPGLIAGKRFGAIAVTEPNSGANPLAIGTKAIDQGEFYMVNGSKVFITGAGEADLYLVVLRTEKSASPAGLSCLMIENGTPGFSFGKIDAGLGLRGTARGELVFQNCRVPKTNLLGAENAYLGVTASFMGLAMTGMAGIALGIAQAAFDVALGHAKNRTVAGQTIGIHQAIQFLIADMHLSLSAARSVTYAVARQIDEQPPATPVQLFGAKLAATEGAVGITDKALRVCGGNGYSQEFPLERHLRDARGLTLHFSPSEMLKGMLGRVILGMPPL